MPSKSPYPGDVVWSNTTATPYPKEPDEIRDLLADHVVSPVHFVTQISRMYDAGCRIFVEVGPGRVMSGLIGRILGDKPHLVVPCSSTVAVKRRIFWPPSRNSPFMASTYALKHCTEGETCDGYHWQRHPTSPPQPGWSMVTKRGQHTRVHPKHGPRWGRLRPPL